MRGQKVFAGSVGRVTCHRVNGKGGEVGPELTGVAAKYNRAFLVESVLYPSKQILDGYHSTVISTKDGESYTGFVRRGKFEGVNAAARLGALNRSSRKMTLKSVRKVQALRHAGRVAGGDDVD